MLFDDILPRKRSEAKLRASEDRQAFLLRLSDALRPREDPIAIQREASRILREQLGAFRVADRLAALGLPYLFTIGDVWVEDEPAYRDRPRLEKPIPEQELIEALERLLSALP